MLNDIVKDNVYFLILKDIGYIFIFYFGNKFRMENMKIYDFGFFSLNILVFFIDSIKCVKFNNCF